MRRALEEHRIPVASEAVVFQSREGDGEVEGRLSGGEGGG